MFTIDQIIPLPRLYRQFHSYCRLISENPQPLLIIQKRGEPLVLVNGTIFEELLRFKMDSELAAEAAMSQNQP